MSDHLCIVGDGGFALAATCMVDERPDTIGTEQATGKELAPKTLSPRPLVIVVHGIRDIARWQSEIQATLEGEGFDVELTNYGRMNLLEFLLPVSYFRKRAIEEIWTQIQFAAKLHPGAKISIVAHSFGTYIVAKLLERQFNLAIDRIIFCGSVVSYKFPFQQLGDRYRSLLNEVGTRDPWPALAESVTSGYGSAGTYGFNRPGARDRFHNEAGHGFFLNTKFCRTYWVPFLQSGIVVPGSSPAAPPPLWVRLASIFKFKYLGFLALCLCLLLPIVPERVSPPPEPISGRWDIVMTCANGGQLYESNADFDNGLHYRRFDGPPRAGWTKLSLGRESDSARLSGYLVFQDSIFDYFRGRRDAREIKAVAKREGANFVGRGTLGRSENCDLTITSRN